jgi:sortase A
MTSATSNEAAEPQPDKLAGVGSATLADPPAQAEAAPESLAEQPSPNEEIATHGVTLARWRASLLAWGVIMLGVALGVIGIVGLWQEQAQGVAASVAIAVNPATLELPETTRPRATPQAMATLLLSPTPTPTITPRPLPPVRLTIPKIGLDSKVVETKPIGYTSNSGELVWQWEVANFAAGYLQNSGHPGQPSNIVLAGHNNTRGEVFRYLDRLKSGDKITLYTLEGEYQYAVTETHIIPYQSNPTAGEAKVQELLAPSTSEQLTLLSCYPYYTNADRIVVTAQRMP